MHCYSYNTDDSSKKIGARCESVWYSASVVIPAILGPETIYCSIKDLLDLYLALSPILLESNASNHLSVGVMKHGWVSMEGKYQP